MKPITPPFEGFTKIARLSREIVVTEKIDGTNAQIMIEELPFDPAIYDAGSYEEQKIISISTPENPREGDVMKVMRVGSRSRWITLSTDNFGFARWSRENDTALFTLGPGQHFGEWWGSGIQRGYGLRNGEKRFSLFNSGRWIDSHLPVSPDRQSCLVGGKAEIAPKCCHVVPVLWEGIFSQFEIEASLQILKDHGSAAAPGFMKAEGVVIFHTAARTMFKKTIEKDESPKGRVS